MFRLFLLLSLALTGTLRAEDLPHTLQKIKPSVVAIGSFHPTRAPNIVFGGSGFVVQDGLHVITNAHVVQAIAREEEGKAALGVLTGRGEQGEFRAARVLRLDEEHDLALLKISGTALPALALGDASEVQEGQEVAMTGFPLAATLGLYPATHKGIVAALTPIVRPAADSTRLSPKAVAQLRRASYTVLQLDAIAYPGNSGSPVYAPDSGKVLGVISMTYVKGLKEAAISQPSAITYAIPVQFVQALLQEQSALP